METRAHFVVIGAFTIGVVVAAFFFVMWVAGYGATGDHRRYQIVFSGSVSGLSTGANVLFNGLKVGEVTKLSFVERNPNQVVADIDVTNASAPINSDTKAQLETQGLTGSAAIALIGGAPNAPPLTGEDGRPPVIPSLPTATLADLQTKAGYVLDLANKILVDNAQGIHNTVDNIQSFSLALRNNAGNVDAALKSVSELGKTVEPLAARLQTLSEDADKLVVAIDRDKVRAIVDNVASASGKADSVLDRADRVLAENSNDVRSTIAHLSAFAKTLHDNSQNLDAAMKGFADLGKAVQPAAQRIQSLAEDADKIAKAIEPDKVRSIVDDVQALAGKATSVADRADKVLAEDSSDLHAAITNLSGFAKTLNDNGPNVDAALKGAAELGKNVDRIQGLVTDADKVVRAVDTDKVHGVVDNVESFSRALSASSDNYQTVMREGASLATRLNDASKELGATIGDIDGVFKSIDSKKVSGIVDSISSVASTVEQNRGNIDRTIKNASEFTAKINDSADKLDGLMTSAQSFLGAPGTKGAMSQVGDAAQSVKKLADDLDVRVKDIGAGLSRFSNSGLRQYESLAIQAQRVLDDIDQAVRSLKSNPSQVIWGAKQTLPEYRSGQ
ncbi:MAG: MCE family protein [Hyphomicrobiales bacterium]|nr:MCE family protein [Hyphomicrobiales bacterium]